MVTDGSPPPEEPPKESLEEPEEPPADTGEPHRVTTPALPPKRPPDPIGPFLRPPGPRRRSRDWPVLVFALIVSVLVMAGCCIAGLAVYTGFATAGG